MVPELSFHRRDAEAQRKRGDLKREIPCACVPSSADVLSARHAEEAETLRATGRARWRVIPAPGSWPLAPSGAPQETR